MGNHMELARTERIGTVERCPMGIVNVHTRGVTLHLSDEAFLGFASMIRKAQSVLIDMGMTSLTQE